MPTVGTFLGEDSGGMEKLIMKQIVEKIKCLLIMNRYSKEFS